MILYSPLRLYGCRRRRRPLQIGAHIGRAILEGRLPNRTALSSAPEYSGGIGYPSELDNPSGAIYPSGADYPGGLDSPCRLGYPRGLGYPSA